MQETILEHEESKIRWEYNVPYSLEYEFLIDEDCPMCKNEDLNVWVAPFLYVDVPYKEMVSLIKGYFDMIVSEEIYITHKEHFRARFTADTDVRNKIVEEMQLIESDIPADIDERKALDSVIKSLYARKLYLEKVGSYGREYQEIIKHLRGAIETKLKMKGVIKEGEVNVSLKDLIKFEKESIINSNK